MEYSVKEVSKNIDITEQGLYKRINTNFDTYKEKGYIMTKLIEQPSGTREQTFLTEEGIKDLLRTRPLKQGYYIKDFARLNREAKTFEQPIKPSLAENTGTEEAEKTTTIADANNNTDIIKLLNQTILDLKAENKRLIEKLDTQEERFDNKLKEQKEEFNEAYNRQNEAFQKALNTISLNFDAVIKRLPPPNEELQTEQTITTIEKKEEGAMGGHTLVNENEDAPRGLKGFFNKLFK